MPVPTFASIYLFFCRFYKKAKKIGKLELLSENPDNERIISDQIKSYPTSIKQDRKILSEEKINSNLTNIVTVRKGEK